MPIIPYTTGASEVTQLGDTHDAHVSGVSLKNIFSILGDYWEDYYKETVSLKQLSSGFVELASAEYQRLLEFAQCSNITDSIVHTSTRSALVLFSQEECEITSDGTLKFAIPGLQRVEFLASSIFEPEVVLVRGEHFFIEDECIEFIVDIFQDPKIIFEVYSTDEPEHKKTLFWAGDSVFSEDFVYQRWGRNLYTKEVNSENYRSVVELIQYYFVTAKTIHTLEVLVNALIGVPFTRYTNERVEQITLEASTRSITTTKAVYTCHVGAQLLVAPGQELQRHTLICKVLDVKDYVTDPYWFEGLSFFVKSLVDTTLPEDVIEYLQFNTEYGHIFAGMTIQYGQGFRYGSGRFYGRDGSITLQQVRDAIASVKLTRNTPYPMSIFWKIMDDFLKYNLVCISSKVSLAYFRKQKVTLPELFKIIESGFPVYLDIYWDASVSTAFVDSVGTFSADLFVNLDSGLLDQGVLLGSAPISVNEFVGFTESPAITGILYGSGKTYSAGYYYAAQSGVPFYDSFEFTTTPVVGPGTSAQPLYYENSIVFYGQEAVYLGSDAPVSGLVVLSDYAETLANAVCSGNVITNDTGTSLTIVAVNEVAVNVGSTVAGSAGGTFTIASDGAWSFDPGAAFTSLADGETTVTAVTVTVSDGDTQVVSPLSVRVEGIVWVTVSDDAGTTDAATTTSGNVLANDSGGTLTVSAVNGISSNVGVTVSGSNGGDFVINADGSWTFDPSGDFAALSGSDTATTSVTYHASDGDAEASATLTVTVSAVSSELWGLDEITTALRLEIIDPLSITIAGSTASQIADRSGNARHAAQATAGNQAAYSGGALTFDGAASPNYDYYDLQLAEYGALFFVVKKLNANAKGFLCRDSRTYDRDGLWITSTGATALQRGSSVGAITTGPVATIGQWNVVYAEANGTTRALRVNGGAETTVSSTAKIYLNQIGYYHWEPPMYCFEGQMAFVVGLADAPGTELRQTIEGYLAHAVDSALSITRLVDALPSDHPYKSAPPYVE